ncbi:cyclase family protein [Caldicellulosiruptor changbaiensis]|uniref:Kynurenine formamidase n=1 Tax=Caldicellulosiruptor changbaiensis TaxID=1222016 RepID=A0A3T0D7J5_9FIRM|nr:cyclase family protein [Caldicellulosiruptor changbaiensis]AZT91090.1 cyclase family protein [Caldicellulosiruptor changbaiensis]
MKIIDVSLDISNETISFPGDPKVEVKRVFDITKGDIATVSKLSLSSHTATHIDAPAHFIKGGLTVDKIPLEHLMGKVKIFEVPEEDKITRSFLEKKHIEREKAIFFKTKNSQYLNSSKFYEKYTSLSLDAAEYLIEKGVKVVGIDYLSIEEFGSEDYSVHKSLLSSGIIIIEGLSLLNVSEGEYEFIALPLRVKGCDGAPARVVLIER